MTILQSSSIPQSLRTIAVTVTDIYAYHFPGVSINGQPNPFYHIRSLNVVLDFQQTFLTV
ncbi:MAG: hypothetical protein H7832_15505 [Magnetococcus sp. DMHC-6]